MKDQDIVHYYAFRPSGRQQSPVIYRSVLFLSPEVAKSIVNKRREAKGEKTFGNAVTPLHIAFDTDNGQLYSINGKNFGASLFEALSLWVQATISKEFGPQGAKFVIHGDPINSFRRRQVSDFRYALDKIKKIFVPKDFKDLTVIMADLSTMPDTLRQLPERFQKENYYGGYLSPSEIGEVSFIQQEKDTKEPGRQIFAQKTPFILINISSTAAHSATRQEWAVLSAYREFVSDNGLSEEERGSPGDTIEDQMTYQIKRYTQLGWPFEEVTNVYLSPGMGINNLTEFFDRVGMLVGIADDFAKDGYDNPAKYPYYILMKINPIKTAFDEVVDLKTGQVNMAPSREFTVLDYDPKTQRVLFQLPVFVNPGIIKSLFGGADTPLIVNYNPILNSADVKSEASTYENAKEAKRDINEIKNYIIADLQDPEKARALSFRTAPGGGAWAANPAAYTTRRVSSYPSALDIIKEMCEEVDVPFNDIEVLIGPVQQLLGQGSVGGFLSDIDIRKRGIETPIKISEGTYFTPPAIFIDSGEYPSYADQIEFLVHEYQHYIYRVLNPDAVKTYGEMSNIKGDENEKREYWTYLTDPDEHEAHKKQIRYALLLGKSVDRIVADKFGYIPAHLWPVALKYRELIREVINEIKEERQQNEEPIGTSE